MHKKRTNHLKMMNTPISMSALFLILLCSWTAYAAHPYQDRFLKCLSRNFKNQTSFNSDVIHTPDEPSYTSILQLSIQNQRFASKSIPEPLVIITPEHESQIPPVVHCARQHGLQIRTRSGGHDFEGLSYISQFPFVVIDFINFTEVKIDVEQKTAWVESGATIGQLYYEIAGKSPILGFPAGICSTVGVGGHLSGGGYGTLMRKYGLAGDNVIDARLVDADGRILDRKSMGEDLFWAIRGGGGASFGVILSWKIRLVDVPERVTLFTIPKTLEQNATHLVNRWQHIAPRLDRDLYLTVDIRRANGTISASFSSVFLGGVDRLLPYMQENFPELGVVREDCTEMSWIESTLSYFQLPLEPREVLLNRTLAVARRPFKAKSDYVQKPIPEHGFEGIWPFFSEPEAEEGRIYLTPYGGRMGEISESATPFPHRAGNLYKIQYLVFWKQDEVGNSDRYINWTRRFYSYMTPYASRNPRAAYFNYRDLDIGINDEKGKPSYKQASVWGHKYFKNNFDRLVRVKTMVDPDNFFRNEQSIPPLRLKWN